MLAPRLFVVIGNPVAHSRSPAIHARFARATGVVLEYSTLLAPLDGFDRTARAFFAAGGSGANVTLPFKLDALKFADAVHERARVAGAANVLTLRDGRIEADNTDGVGLLADLTRNLRLQLAGSRMLLLGAGGAARGVVAPLLSLSPEHLVVANRGVDRARALADSFAQMGVIRACALDAIEGGPFDLVVNATSASTHGETLALPRSIFAAGATAYDMAYGLAAHAFLEQVQASAARACDGLGMLVEQAAEAFLVWHGMRPETAPVISALRAGT